MKRMNKTHTKELQCHYKNCKYKKRYPLKDPTYCVKHKDMASDIGGTLRSTYSSRKTAGRLKLADVRKAYLEGMQDPDLLQKFPIEYREDAPPNSIFLLKESNIRWYPTIFKLEEKPSFWEIIKSFIWKS